MRAAAKPPSRFRSSARAAGMGLALGVGSFVAGTLLNSKIAQAILQLEQPSRLLWPLLDPQITAPILVAPAVCYLAGLVFDGARWTLVVSTIVALQASLGLVLALTVHREVALSPSQLAIAVAAGGVGVALSGWTMKLGQRRPSKPASSAEQPARTEPAPGDEKPKA